MPGGNWVTQNKRLPGVYINYVGEGNNPAVTGDRGAVGLPLPFPWLPEHEITTVYPSAVAQYVADFGDAALLLNEAMKNATLVYLYRLDKGAKAKAQIGDLICTARYSGEYGNRFSVSVENVVGEPGWFYIVTWYGLDEAERQKVEDISQAVDNEWIEFSAAAGSAGSLTANAGTALAGGANGNVTMSDYVKFLSAIEMRTVNAIACPIDDVDIRNLFVSFAKRMINDEGKYLQAVVAHSKTADFEGVVSIQNGVYLENGTHITPVMATAYMAGATARCPLDQSLTNAQYIGAVDVDERYTVQEQTVFAATGQIVFIPSPTADNKVLVQKDINTLVTITKTRTYALSKNKIIRILFAVATEITNRAMVYYSGKVQNNQDGRDLFHAEILSYFRSLEEKGILQDVVPGDIVVKKGELIDAVVVDYAIRPSDVMETFYNTIKVQG